MRNYVYGTLGNERVKFCYTEGFALCVGYNLSKTHFSIKSRRGWQRESCLRNGHWYNNWSGLEKDPIKTVRTKTVTLVTKFKHWREFGQVWPVNFANCGWVNTVPAVELLEKETDVSEVTSCLADRGQHAGECSETQWSLMQLSEGLAAEVNNSKKGVFSCFDKFEVIVLLVTSF